MTPDRIEKTILLHAPLERVWRAVSDATQFGTGSALLSMSLHCGCRTDGRSTPTKVDPEVAKLQKPYEGKPFAFSVDSIEPMHRIAFRWHPYAVEPGIDYLAEPTTLIIFELKEVEGGTRLQSPNSASTASLSNGGQRRSRRMTVAGASSCN